MSLSQGLKYIIITGPTFMLQLHFLPLIKEMVIPLLK